MHRSTHSHTLTRQFESLLKEYDQQLKVLNEGRASGQKYDDVKTIFEHAAGVRSEFVRVFVEIAEDTDADR